MYKLGLELSQASSSQMALPRLLEVVSRKEGDGNDILQARRP